jgi:hypothetical protein
MGTVTGIVVVVPAAIDVVADTGIVEVVVVGAGIVEVTGTKI